MPSFQDTELRRFLFGTASPAESEAFTLRILSSADDTSHDTFLEVLADEDDLFDEYVRGELEDEASRRFEEIVLAHPEGRRRLDFARALAERVRKEAERDVTATTPAPVTGRAEQTPTENDESDSLLRRLLGGFRAPGARPVWVLCLLLFAFAVAQTYRVVQLEHSASLDTASADADAAKASATPSTATASTTESESEESESDRTNTPSEVAKLRDELEHSTHEIEGLRAELEAARSEAQTAAQTAAQSARAAAPKVVSILLAVAVRGSADQIPTLDLPDGTDMVELQVDLSGGTAVETVRVRLLDATRFPVWGNPRVEPEGNPGIQGLRVRVPSSVFAAEGGHTLILEAPDGDGSWSELGYYEFRVGRP